MLKIHKNVLKLLKDLFIDPETINNIDGNSYGIMKSY